MRDLDVESSQESDGPRQCGYALLHSLLLANEKNVVETLTHCAQELRQVLFSATKALRLSCNCERCWIMTKCSFPHLTRLTPY